MRYFRHLEKKLENVSVFVSLRIVFYLFCLIPVILLSTTYLSFVYKTMLKWEEEKVETSIMQSSQIFSKYLDDVKMYSDKIYINKPLKKILAKQYEDVQEVYTDYSSVDFLEQSMTNYILIENFRIYTENQTLLDNSFIVKASYTIRNASWYSNAIILRGQVAWQLLTDPINQKEYLCLVRSLWERNEFLGVLVIYCNISRSKMTRDSVTYDSAIFANNKFIYGVIDNLTSNDKAELGAICESYDFEKCKLEKKPFRLRTIAVKGYSFAIFPYSNMTFKILYLIPLSQLNNATFKMVVFAIFILLLIIFFIYAVLTYYSAFINERFRKIQKGIDKVVKNQFEIEESIGGKDEFESVYHALYKMSNDIKNLIQQVYIRDLENQKILSKQNEINFKMLCAQINPHFLFNTLESIRMKALSLNDRETAKQLKLLASLLRYNLSLKNEPVPLVQEFEIVETYLKIQKMRFGERINYTMENVCDEDQKILPLLIQPIVENAVKYALENNIEGGNLEIRAYTEFIASKKFLMVKIQDDGPGIEKSKLEELNVRFSKFKDDRVNEENRNLSQDDLEQTFISYKSKYAMNGTSIGLENVNSRIKLYYGKNSGVYIESGENMGTSVKLKIELKF